MNAPTDPKAAPVGRSDHDVHMLALPVRVAVQRDTDGRVTGLECLKADDVRRRLVEAAGREIASGRSVEALLLQALAYADLLRGLSAIERQAGGSR